MSEEAKNGDKPGRMHALLRDQRVLLGISVLLAAIVWLVLAVVNGEEQVLTIENVPVRADFTGTVFEELGLQPFWSGPQTNPEALTVTVVVRCRRYENIREDTVSAKLVTENVSVAGLHDLAIRVEADRERFTVVSVSPGSIPLFFDHPKTLEFKLTPEIVGELRVAEGYHAEEVLLSKQSVAVSGPARLVEAIAAVKAEIAADEVYSETKLFQNIPIVPVSRGGDTSPYLTVEEGAVNATLPVWKRTPLHPAVDFQNVPGAYLGAPLPVTVSPAAVSAALPEDRIAEDLRYSVGPIDFHTLSPGNTRFSFPVSDLKEIRLFDEIAAFTAVVDLAGFDARRLALPGAQITAAPHEGLAAGFGDVANVTVVGPAEAVAALTPEALTGEIEIPEDARPGQTTLPVTIRVDRDDCWVYGAYTVRATITE